MCFVCKSIGGTSVFLILIQLARKKEEDKPLPVQDASAKDDKMTVVDEKTHDGLKEEEKVEQPPIEIDLADEKDTPVKDGKCVTDIPAGADMEVATQAQPKV